MVHRKNNHLATVAYCRNLAEGNCSFTADSCWWNHAERENIKENVQCFICGKTFDCKSEMMGHRKKKHSSIVQQCTQFLKGSCRFQNKFCWYKHNIETENEKSESPEDVFHEEEGNENETSSVFQEAVNNPEPPSGYAKENTKTQN